VHHLVYLCCKDRLLELFGADPKLVDSVHPQSGMTPLFALPNDEAAALDMARFLLEHGGDASIRNASGDTAADAARKRGFSDVSELLAKAKAGIAFR
jgi:hypothetical protein